MANAPFPPLFCSTPPPIDDANDDDDDEFGDFADAYQENLNLENTCNDDFNEFPNNIEQLPEKDITETNIPKINFNCDSFEKTKEDANKNTKLMNNHTAHTSLSSLYEQTSSSTSTSKNELEDDYKHFIEYHQYDKSFQAIVKSDSGGSTGNDSVVEKQRDLPTLSNIVRMEDVVDDSSDDERLSPRNRNVLRCDENSSDYFAIYSIDDAWRNDDNKAFPLSVCESSQIEKQILANEEDKVPEKDSFDLQNQQFGTAGETQANENIISDEIKNINYSPDIESSPNKSVNSIDIEDDDDDFANFQDFTSAPVAQNAWTSNDTKFETSSQSWNALPINSGNSRDLEIKQLPERDLSDNKKDDNDDDDDDFGDFSEAPVVTLQQNLFEKTSKSLEDQLKSILDSMFPRNVAKSIHDAAADALGKPEKITCNSVPMELALVESAKALEYQWPSSFVRHEFIKSLGIDSRNIFLTEKWNSSMPRFAANLSFDPLQPLKPTSLPLPTESAAVTSIVGSKPDVPVVEFDWKSSGLVNPLDASHVHTLLLDVDQLVVVANLDNINLDSYSSCSQSSATLTTTTTTTMETATSLPLNKTNDINGTMASTTGKTMTKMMSKIQNDNITDDANVFHGDNLQLNSIGYDALCTYSNASDTANNILDLHCYGNCNDLLSTTLENTRHHDCNLPFPMHLHNNNNNNNKNNTNNNISFATLNAIDTCFGVSVTTATATATESLQLLLPTTSVAFTNHLQFNELHNSLAAQTSSNLTPKSSSILITTTTTILTTTTKPPTSTEITNIAHHNDKKIQMPMSTVSITNPYREPRPQAEMGKQSAVASKAEYSNADDIENENGNENGSSGIEPTTEASTVATTTAGGTLPSIVAGSGNVNGTDKIINNNIDIGLFDVPLPKDVKQDVDDKAKESEEIKVLEIEGCTSNETTVTLYSSMDGEAEVRIENGVISRSTFAGPLKETHIFTPSKNMSDIYEKNIPNPVRCISPTSMTIAAPKVVPIDFDYEKAAAGIIIDEKVVHKEYRDVEYNPGFDLEGNQSQQRAESPALQVFQTTKTVSTAQQKQQQNYEESDDDEFTDFQSVPAPAPEPECLRTATSQNDKLSTPTPINGMILSPAILLPQAISMENKQPKIEWGNSAANIDPDELARIEQLFPQKNISKKSSPIHAAMQQQNSLSISATIANQKSHDDADDDDWSDFVSVQVPATNRNSPRNFSRPETNNDDEWSDFVSVQVPAANNTQNSYVMPQFNSASWQNPNIYNNPLSVYHRNQTNFVPNATKFHNNNNNYHHNNNFNNSNNNFTQYLHNFSATPKQQKIQVLQDFSTIPSDFKLYRPNIPHSNNTGRATTTSEAASSHFQVGSAKVAPTVSLIPDLGFVAPAMPVHTSIINALPKPSGNFKQK